MFSGVKSKLQQWRKKKKPPRLMEFPSKDTIQHIAVKNKDQLQNLSAECKSIIEQLKDQVLALSSIDEDSTAVTEKICMLEDNQKALENGLKISEEFIKCLEFTSLLGEEINKCSREISDLHSHASSMVKENKSLRAELAVAQDRFWTLGAKSVELEVQVQHLKFMNSLPVWKPFMEDEDEVQNQESSESFLMDNKETLPLLGDDLSDFAGSSIISLLESFDATEKRLKILLDLIKSYIHKQAFEIALPLLKTTVEDLKKEYDSHSKIILSMTEAIAIAYSVTKRHSEAIEVFQDIKRIRTDWMPEDIKGLAKTYSSLAVLNTKAGNFKKAWKCCEQALELKNKVYGAHNPETAQEQHNLGVLCFHDGQHSKAIDYLVKAKNSFQSSAEKHIHPLARCSTNLALVKVEIGQTDEAKKIFQSVLKTLNNHLDKLLENTKLSKEEVLEDQYQIEENFEGPELFEIRRICSLAAEIKEKLKSLS